MLKKIFLKLSLYTCTAAFEQKLNEQTNNQTPATKQEMWKRK